MLSEYNVNIWSCHYLSACLISLVVMVGVIHERGYVQVLEGWHSGIYGDKQKFWPAGPALETTYNRGGGKIYRWIL